MSAGTADLTMGLSLVMASGLLHAIWNLFTKQSLDKAVFLWWCQWVASLVYLPWALSSLSQQNVPVPGWFWLATAVVLHSIYVLLLSPTYTLGDLSQVYPIMRGMSPLLVPLIGVVVLGESLSILGWLGVASIVVGIALLGDWRCVERGKNQRYSFRPSVTVIALLVGLSITLYTTVDKISLAYIPAVTLNDASNFGNLIALTWIAIRSRGIAQEWKVNWRTILLVGVISPGGYLLFLTALRLLPLAQLAPIRELGTVFATLLGLLLLKEKQGRRRICAASMITVGVIVLGAWGTP